MWVFEWQSGGENPTPPQPTLDYAVTCLQIKLLIVLGKSSNECAGSPDGSEGKRIRLQCGRPGFDPWVGTIPWRRAWQPTPVFLPGEFQGQRSLTGYSPWGCKESDTTEHTCTHTCLLSLSLSKSQPCLHQCNPDTQEGLEPLSVVGWNESTALLKRDIWNFIHSFVAPKMPIQIIKKKDTIYI